MTRNFTTAKLYFFTIALAALGLLALPFGGTYAITGAQDRLVSSEQETQDEEVDWTLAKEEAEEDETDWTLAKDEAEEDETDWTLAKDEAEEDETDWTLA